MPGKSSQASRPDCSAPLDSFPERGAIWAQPIAEHGAAIRAVPRAPRGGLQLLPL